MKKVFIVLFIAIIGIIVFGIGNSQMVLIDFIQNETNKPYAQYISPEGICFESYSKKWDEKKLEQLYQSFEKNAHSKEIRKLYEIKLVPQEGNKLGEINLKWITDFKGNPIYLFPYRTITLYYADKYDTPESLSFTLSHEYGHLFTFYWLFASEGKLPGDPNTHWANIRNIKQYPIRWSNSNLEYDHFWQPEEILADDYATLFGSPDGKTKLTKTNEINDPNELFVNKIENHIIPSPESVKGLRQYWEQISGIKSESDSLKEPHLIKIISTKERQEIEFAPASDDPKNDLRYFVRWSQIDDQGVSIRTQDTFVQTNTNPISILNMPNGTVSIQIFSFDEKTKQLIHSPMYCFDFKNAQHPVPIENPLSKTEK